MDTVKISSVGNWFGNLSVRTKLVLGFTVLSTIVSGLTAGGIYTNLLDETIKEFSKRVLVTAKVAAFQQNGNEFRNISSSQDPLYEKFRVQNLKIRKSDPDIAYVYTLRKDDQGIYFVVDAGEPGESNISAYGERYPDAVAFLVDNFNNMPDGIVEPEFYTDQYGTFLSAYAPILTDTGEQVGVIGIDIFADTIREKQRETIQQSIFVIIFALVIGAFFGLLAGNALTNPIVKLTKSTADFASGKLDQTIEIDTKDEIGTLATTFNQMAGKIKELIDSLELRVADRTKDLEEQTLELESANRRIQSRATQFEALAQVTQTITSVRDLQSLLPIVTKVISQKFGFYHVGIFLLDEVGQYAILSASNSEGGQRMLERRHRLRVGEEGIVGYATARGKPRIAMDVGLDAVYFNNPDLPNTHSEMALPLISNNIIVGALDVQSTEIAAFTEEDVQMLSLLADQVSLAIENARLFEETRRALGEAEAISRQITREGFAQLSAEQDLVGYQYNVSGARPLREPLPLTGSAKGKGITKQTESSQVVVPIELRGETIGMLAVQTPSLEALNQDQIDLIKAVAERVALSAENARLFDETSRRAERERMVSEISGKIRSVNDPDLMIKTAMEELRQALGASRVEVIPQVIKGQEQ
jgi:GAF domain-containing protein/HAMP domain-containing protein